MKSILEKTRNINRQLQKAGGKPVDFDEIAMVLSETIGANCYIVGRKGKILGYATLEGFTCDLIEEMVYKKVRLPVEYNKKLLRAEETQSNITKTDITDIEDGCMFEKRQCLFRNKPVTIVPIAGGGQRLGTLVLTKFGAEFTDSDLVLAEYGATVVGMEILKSRAEQAEEQARKHAAVHSALGTLSFTEKEAVEQVFAELDGSEGVLVASKIADRAGITRSVIVNALRKFESAGVIETKSLGMKGTYIRVLNDLLLEELDKVRG